MKFLLTQIVAKICKGSSWFEFDTLPCQFPIYIAYLSNSYLFNYIICFFVGIHTRWFCFNVLFGLDCMLVTYRYSDSQMRHKDRQKSPIFCCKKSGKPQMDTPCYQQMTVALFVGNICVKVMEKPKTNVWSNDQHLLEQQSGATTNTCCMFLIIFTRSTKLFSICCG